MTKPYALPFLILFAVFSISNAQDHIEQGIYDDPKIPALLAIERDSLPVDGEVLYALDNVSHYTFSNNNGATRQILDADTTMPFGKKIQMDIKKAGNNGWEPQFQSPLNEIAVNNGDVLLMDRYRQP